MLKQGKNFSKSIVVCDACSKILC